MNKIKILPAKYYQAGFDNNLAISGIEEGMPQWIGNDEDFANFDRELINITY